MVQALEKRIRNGVFQTEAGFKPTDRPASCVQLRLSSENSSSGTDAERRRDKRAADRAPEWDRKATCNLEFTANVSVRWDLSEPSLSLILLWILKPPHLSRSSPWTPLLPPFLSPLLLLFLTLILLHLFYFWMYMMLCSVRLSSSRSVSSSLCEWDSCPTMKLRKHGRPPWDVAVREHRRSRQAHCLLCLIEFFILIYEKYIAGAGAEATASVGAQEWRFVCPTQGSYFLLSVSWNGAWRVRVRIGCSATLKCLWFTWQADVPEEPSCHVGSGRGSAPWGGNLLKVPLETCERF